MTKETLYIGRGVQVTVEPSSKELKRRHQERARELSALELPNAKAAIYLDRWVQINFRTEGGNVGGWEPFANGGRPIYEPRRAAPGQKRKLVGIDTSAKLLQDTGNLRLSFLPFYNARTAGIGSELPYSKTHEEGADHVPQRRMLPKRAEVIKPIRQIYRDHVRRALGLAVKNVQSGIASVPVRGLLPRG